MSSLSLTLALCLCLACLAAADVSHLPSSYLPPPKPEHAVSMSIEQQELRELPEQVEYMRENEQGVMEAMPSSLLTPPAPLETEQMDAMLSSRYLPPAPQMEQRSEPEMQQQQPQMEMEPEQPQMAMRYLPPPAATSEEQLTYQQYQEQMQMQQQQQQQEQMPHQEEQMPYYMDVQQPMAPTDVEAEPVPAHELRSDGYHYKQAKEQLRLRH
ncbi:mediator of RNA polymerase II transcription subunit 15 [Drosophila guanche]|uniref:Uncharacterized protein n=1 Tax=Drosophila guanche TaxID=7266 RepID=A0A3B0JT68_DROGU|nr:mediator of RNA polymerase II transcription subunit 15 [Drosophila guanche]SPP85314.1 Hypothetical predicted protein [Drosophila guanche]